MTVTLPTLYPHQADQRDRVRTALAKHRRVILCAPPGVGKTRMSKVILGACLNSTKGERASGKYLWAVHRRGLVDNAIGSFSEEPPLPHGVIMSDRDTAYGERLQVASIDSILSWFIENNEYHTDITFDLIVFDETHSDLPKLAKFLKYHDAKREALGLHQAYVIGLTATPQAKGLADVYREIVLGPSTQWLIDNEFLSPFRYVRATQGRLGLLVKRGGEYTKDSEAAAMDGLAGDLVRDWKRFAEGRATVGFFPRRSHAKDAQGQLEAAGLRVAYVDGETPDEERNLTYKRLNDGNIDYLCNVALVERGTDIPRIGCVQLCVAIGSLVRYRQIVGRGSRRHPEKTDCVAEGELVLTNQGLVPIDKVSSDMLIWDGVEFVSHDGAVCKGDQDVIACGGVFVTPDHKMWTASGWRRAIDCFNQGIPVAVGGDGREAIRETDRRFRPSSLETETRVQGTIRNDGMYCLRDEGIEVSLPFGATTSGLSVVSRDSWMAPDSMRGCSATVLQSEQARVLPVRWEGGGIQVPEPIGDGSMDYGEPWRPKESATGSDQQYGALRGGQSAVGHTEDERMQQAGDSGDGWDARLSVAIPRSQVRRQHDQALHPGGDDVSGDRTSVQPTIVQTTRRVWDILNAGPRHRFVVGGLIVSNCVVLDHGNNVARCGFFEDDPPWSLDVTTQDPGEVGARPTIECPKCQAIYRGGLCKHCGYEPTPRERRSAGLEFDGSELREVTRNEHPKKNGAKTAEQLMVSALYRAGLRGKTWKQAVGLFKQACADQGTPHKVPSHVTIAGRRYSMIRFGSDDCGRRVETLYPIVLGKHGGDYLMQEHEPAEAPY